MINREHGLIIREQCAHHASSTSLGLGFGLRLGFWFGLGLGLGVGFGLGFWFGFGFGSSTSSVACGKRSLSAARLSSCGGSSPSSAKRRLATSERS